ncbi:uncharacterized protein LOC119644963 [Glossina fuscipes]|uniref:Uncharacterized protein LOC119644963 n=1 Tax=Glossina fuscipes TaxID=7396 RepID=A0A9C6E263_9MUSC|nr:uncharacterized protein LOC119644963 [Glossina fuscipes]
MAILESCCFWNNVWRGSLASAIYTMVYFSISSLVLLAFIGDEWEYVMGEQDRPRSETMIEKGIIGKLQFRFNIAVLICSVGLVISSAFMICGLIKEISNLLIPWMILMATNIVTELAYFFNFAFGERANFEPIVAFIFTMDFFIISLNVYCLICVASQYQVFKECERLDNRESISNEDLHVPINMPIANLTAAPLKRTHKSIFPTIIEEVA